MTTVLTNQTPQVSMFNLSPFFKSNGEPLKVLSGKNKGKVILVDGLTLAQLHDGLNPKDLKSYVDNLRAVGKNRIIKLSHIDPRTYEQWSDLINRQREERYNDVYESFVRNGLIERPNNVNKDSLRIRYNVIQKDADDLPDGDYAPMSDRMTDLKSPISLIGATGDIFAKYIYRYGTVAWIRDQFTAEQQQLMTFMMIDVMRQRQKNIFVGVKGRYDGLIPPTDPAKEKIHGTIRMDATDAKLGTFVAGAWEDGADLQSARKIVTAAIRYMRRPVLDPPTDPNSGQDSLAPRFVLYLGGGLYDHINELVLDEADRIETTLMQRLVGITQVAEVVEAVDLPRGSFMLVNTDVNRTSHVEVVPMTTSMSQEPLVGEDLRMILYTLSAMKVIATAEYKKNNIMVDNA